MKEIKLFWEGLWDITEEHAPLSIPESPGILMLIEARYTPNKIGFDTESYRLLEVCETRNIYALLQNQKRLQSWKSKCSHRLLLKIAKTEPGMNRREIINLICGDPSAAPDLVLSNIGYKLPLKATYSSPAKEIEV